MTRQGDWIVAWSDYGQGAFGDAVAQRFAITGTRIGGEFLVNASTQGGQSLPSPALSPSGSFVIVWTENSDLEARLFASTGTPIGGDFQVNLQTQFFQYDFELAASDAGHFVVTWSDRGPGDRIFAQRFSRNGVRSGGEFQVNIDTAITQRNPAIGMTPAGDFVIAWWSTPGLPDISVERARRFAPPRLDINGDAFAAPLTDGIMVLRWLFGFRGDALVAGALGDCSRCDAADIEAYLTAIEGQLDIDGSGDLAALTDGLLVLRHLFGFTGAALVNGAVDLDDCVRCEADDIADWIAALSS